MAGKRDYYEVLGVDRAATEKQLSEAYRKLAMKYHPDRNPGDEDAVARFKEAAEAFEVLGNSQKRQLYDQYGHAGLESRGAGPQFHDVGDIMDAFGDLFGLGGFFGGGRRRRRGPRPGADVPCQVELTLEEAAKGVEKAIEFLRPEFCPTCHGSGAKPGTQPETCRYCGGRGQVVQSSGIFSVQTTCPSCRGSGAIIRERCGECRGTGAVEKKVRLEIAIPAGIEHGEVIAVQGQGEPSAEGGPRGNCLCVVAIKEHPFLQRNGRHLVCKVPISYAQAALGAKIEVPTLEGRDEIEVPRGTQTGSMIRVKGKGMPDRRTHARGDLIVQVNIEVPKRLTPEHERLLRELAELENHHVSNERKSFFGKLKEYFQAG